MNLLKNNKEFIIGLILTLSLLWPLVWAPYFTHHDDVQVIRLYEMDKCIKDLQIPCRWVPDLGGLYGYPLFNYYAPFPYYFGEIIYLVSGNLIFSAKVMFAISFLGAYVFMYLVASKYWGKLGGSLAGIFYSFAPYHALDLYIRGAMGELWGLMLFPAILWAVTKLKERLSIGNLLLFGLFVALLITSHNLSAMIFLPVVILWIILLFFKKKSYKFLWLSLISIILGLTLAVFYLLPMLLEKNLVHVETTTYGYFGYSEHFKGFKKLFLDRSWGFGSSIREVPGGEKEKVSFQIGWIHILGWLLALVTAWKFWRKNRWVTLVILVSTAVVLFAIYMINPRSEFIWKIILPLKYLQFPWRFMMIIIFFISFIAGSIFLVVSNTKRYLIWAGLIFAVVIFNFSYFRPEKFLETNDKDQLSGANWDRLIKRSIFDYLPIFAKEPPAELANSRYQVLTGDITITDFQQGTNWLGFKADTKAHTIIRLSQYYFPNWRIMVDGKEIPIDYKNNNLGLMTFILGVGRHDVQVRLYNTPVRTLANLVTLIGFVFTISLFLMQFPKVRQWIHYYKKGIS